jgi:hypothetical protein
MPPPRPAVAVALLLAAVVAALPGCTRTRIVERRVGRLPPIPSISSQPSSPNEPPIVWVGGTLTDATQQRLVVQDALGSSIRLLRLAGGATVFYRVQGSRWQRVPDAEPIPTGGPACVETLMDGSNLLALRVFLGATCGPA